MKIVNYREQLCLIAKRVTPPTGPPSAHSGDLSTLGSPSAGNENSTNLLTSLIPPPPSTYTSLESPAHNMSSAPGSGAVGNDAGENMLAH